MKEKFPLSYRTIQRIKAEEYERFFARLPEYLLHMNHLGEVQWMTEDESFHQHEFFPYSLSAWDQLKRRYRLKRKIALEKLSRPERELRLNFRQLLQERYLGAVDSRTRGLLPSQWTYDIDKQELANIPLTLEFGNEDIWKRLVVLAGAVALASMIAFIWVLNHQEKNGGQLLVRSEIPGGRIYLNDSHFLGYTNRVIENVPLGLQRLSARKDGFSTLPEYRDIEILSDSLISVDITFVPLRIEIMGYVKILGDQGDSKVFFNDQFAGTLSENPVLSLEAAEYRISLQKDGYLSFPPQKLVRVTARDTSVVSFYQIQTHEAGRRSTGSAAGNIGSLSVSSNIKSASIFLNGRDTGEKTDHIFTQLPLGFYAVQVRKPGFGIDPREIDVQLTGSNASGNARFQLSQELELVRINVSPPGGKIYMDGDLMGETHFEDKVPLGEHRLTFGEMSGFKKPLEQTITVKNGNPLTVNVNYFPELRINAGVNNRGNIIQENCQVFTGHTFKDRAFTPSTEGAPSIEYYDRLNDYFWKLGFAFAYRNPKGNDAVKVLFELPKNLNYEQKFTLKVHGVSSRDKYPFALSTSTEITVKFNNTILSYYYSPKFVEDLGRVDITEWDITPQIRGGSNTLEIYTTDKNNTYYYLKKIEIFN